jgi:hypothetical protein
MTLDSIRHAAIGRRESLKLPRGVHRTRVSEMRWRRARADVRVPVRPVERAWDAWPPGMPG